MQRSRWPAEAPEPSAELARNTLREEEESYLYGKSPNERFGEEEHRDFEGRQIWRGKNFTGRGPKGYRRSDESIRDEVCSCLTRDPDVDPTDVEVTVNDGVVRFVGTVPDRWSKKRMEEIAEFVSGVEDVENLVKMNTKKAA